MVTNLLCLNMSYYTPTIKLFYQRLSVTLTISYKYSFKQFHKLVPLLLLVLLLLFKPIFQGLALNVLKIPVLNYSVLMMLVSSKHQVGQPIYIVTPIIQILTVMLQFCNFPTNLSG